MREINRKLRVELLEARQMLTAYMHSAAADFAADFSGGLPQNNPNGDWTYLASDDTTTSLVATNGSFPVNTFGIGAGWAETPGGIPSYAVGGALGLPTGTIAGHGPQKVVWTAPAEVDLGGVEITGLLTQHFSQATRQMQLRIFKNNSSEQFLTVNADFVSQTAIVPFPTTQVAIDPGDTLTIIVDGAGPLGDGVSTFAAWDVVIEEIDPGIDADFNGDFSVDANDLPVWETGYGLIGSAAKADGDADGDMDVDGADWLLWQLQLGNSIDSGFVNPVYNPTAVIVQTSGVTLPDGTALDITGTQTDGLQEAFDFAADFGWGLFVLPGTYNLDAHLDIVERQGASFRLQDVTLNFGSSVTDFGVRFDSTMIVDWYWDGGALNAPNATDGVRFEPRTPHPLDGILLGTKGVVDSRFHFNVDITAGTNKVTMNTLQATINEIYFHFQNVTEAQINYIGSGFADTNTFLGARTDSAIPWDIFTTAGRVTVAVPNGPIGTVARAYKPDGTLVDTAGTTTSGLQEAFNYAAANDLDVLVFGRGIENTDPFSNAGLYNLNNTLTVGNLNNRTYRIFNVTFNYTQTGTAMILNDVVSSDFELTGQVVGVNASTGVLIKPLSTPITNSVIRIQHVPIINDNTGSVGVRIDPSLQTIENSDFFFAEILGGDVGLRVESPSATTFFRNNLLSTLHTHDWKTLGLKLGTNATNSDNIHTNTIDIHTNTDGGPATTSLQVWGDNNTITFSSLGAGQTGAAARLESSSANNVVTHFQVNGALVDLGTNNSFIAALVAANSSGYAPSNGSLANLVGFQLGTQKDAKQVQAEIESFAITTPIAPQLVAATRDPAEQTMSARDAAFSDFVEDEAPSNFLLEEELSRPLAIDLAMN